jgi:hypothetical protein
MIRSFPFALAAALVVFSPPAFAGNGMEALKLLPEDTNIVLNVNFKRLRGSKAYNEILSVARARDAYKSGVADLKKAGIDLERDVDTLVLGVRGQMGGGDPDGVVLVAEGRFRPARLIKLMREKNADMKSRSHAGVTYYTLDNDGSLAILGKRVILAENSRMAAVIDLFKGKGPSLATTRAFKGLISKTDTGKDLWFVAELPKDKGGGFGVPMGESLRSFTGSLDLRKGLGIALRMGTTDTNTARTMVSQFEMLRGMAANEEQVKKLGLDTVIQKARVVADETDVLFRVDLTPAEARRLSGLAEMAGGAM